MWVWVGTILLLGFLAFQFGWAMMIQVGAVQILATMAFFHKGWLAAQSPGRLVEEQEQGTLEMLLSTPLSAAELVRGHFLALRRDFRGPVALLLGLHVLAVGFLLFAPESMIPPRAPRYWIAAGLAVHGAMYVYDLYLIGWAGLWSATIVKKPKNAGGTAVVICFVIPVAVFALIMGGGAAIFWYVQAPAPRGGAWIFALWFAIGAINNTVWIGFFRKALPGSLRRFAVRRYTPEVKTEPWWRRLRLRVGA